MFKSKISERVQEVILPDFPDDENTVPTVTKSRRVSFGTNFVKEFIVGSTVSGQCLTEYEQAFPSSDSSTADSSHSVAESGILEHSMFAPPPPPPPDIQKMHKQPLSQPVETDFPESRPKLPKFSSTVCFSADSPTADMEFTEGCITLAKSILDKKNKEMTVIIQAKPKEPKDEEKPKDEETKYFDGSQFEMSMTRCLKSKGNNKREEKRFESEKTQIFSKYENEMSITRCSRILNEYDAEESWEECKENRMPLDMIMRHLDKDNSDLESDLFNPDKTFGNFFNADALDLTNDSEKLNLNESMDISTDFLPRGPRNLSQSTASPENLIKKSVKADTAEITEKSFLLPRTDDSAEEMSLDEGQPFERVPSPKDSQSADSKMEKSSLEESERVDGVQSLVMPSICEEKSNTSIQKMILDASGEACLPSIVEPTATDHKISETTEENEPEEVVTCEKEASVLDLPSTDKMSESVERLPVDLSTSQCKLNKSTEKVSLDVSNEVEMPEKETTDAEQAVESAEQMSMDVSDEVQPSEIAESLPVPICDNKINTTPQKMDLTETEGVANCEKEESLQELKPTDKIIEPIERTETEEMSTEPSLVDIKIIEGLKEQSKEPGCVWSLKDLRHPQKKTQGWLSFNCKLLESSTSIHFELKMTNEDSPVACSAVTNSEISLNEEEQYQLPEYRLVVGFGFDKLKNYFNERRTQVESIRHVTYFLDQINSFMLKVDGCLRQIHTVLTLYPGSRLEGSRLSFRLFSFPIFFSSTVSIDLSNYFRLSKSSLSFETDFGSLDENKIREIFEDCLKHENCLCEFIIESTKYLIGLERKSGCVSKRGHIRLLPAELKL